MDSQMVQNYAFGGGGLGVSPVPVGATLVSSIPPDL
jgi:hypothetical protein